jgi:hypothetical protein
MKDKVFLKSADEQSNAKLTKAAILALMIFFEFNQSCCFPNA